MGHSINRGNIFIMSRIYNAKCLWSQEGETIDEVNELGCRSQSEDGKGGQLFKAMKEMDWTMIKFRVF